MGTDLRRPLLPASPRSTGGSLRHLVIETWPGRLLVTGLLLKLLTTVTGTSVAALRLADRLGAVALVIGGGYLVYRLFRLARSRLLWRVRRKLIISYVFIGVVPVLLVVTFFVLVGLLLFFNVSSYLVQARLQDLEDQAQAHASATATQLRRGPTEPPQTVLLRRYAAVQAQFPEASMALVPTVGDPPCGVQDEARLVEGEPSGRTPIFIGPWTHVDPPRAIPRWIDCSGFAGLLFYQVPGEVGNGDRLLVRAVAFPDETPPAFAVVLDLPVGETIVGRLRRDTGIRVGDVSLVPATSAAAAEPLVGRAREAGEAAGGAAGASSATRSDGGSDLPNAVAILDFIEWERGRAGQLTLAMGVNGADMYARLAAAQGRNSRFGQFLLLVLAVVGGLFLAIEGVALLMGFALARSITGSVHELFAGTERVRQGDFAHKIAVTAQDQLGELSDSFNSMTGSIEGLLQEMEKKRRLEEELRIAREIQMSLLPQGPLSMHGLSVAALCVPAREVGGDYYDLFPLDDQRVGILIADVAGKGTSAALYMAELKGLMLALSRSIRSPRQLMVQANRILAGDLDSRTFITMTYAVIDTVTRTMTYARAGHTPLIHVPDAPDGERRAQVLIPDGMVLGLRLDHGERFEALLEEVTIPLAVGDLFVFFTDGISEAMNEAADCFGEGRLGRLVEEHGHLPSEELRERILREIEAFVGSAEQHDDMTLILLKVEHLEGATHASRARVEEGTDLASARSGA